jgi:hypothetical protein
MDIMSSTESASTITASSTLLLMAAVVALLVITGLTWLTNLGLEERFVNYFAILEGFATLLLLFGLIQAYNTQYTQSRKEIVKKYIETTLTGYVKLKEEILNEFPYTLRLYKDVNQNNPSAQAIVDTLGSSQAERSRREYTEQIMSAQIFAHVANTYLCMNDVSSDWEHDPYLVPWMNLWTLWFRSSLLRKYWNESKAVYNPIARKFVDDVVIPRSLQSFTNAELLSA